MVGLLACISNDAFASIFSICALKRSHAILTSRGLATRMTNHATDYFIYYDEFPRMNECVTWNSHAFCDEYSHAYLFVSYL